jgi:hypothetical protein
MSHLGQFPALALEPNAPVLPIGQDEVLFVFKCEWDSVCSFWDFADGANRVFCLPRKELGVRPRSPQQSRLKRTEKNSESSLNLV